MNLTKQFALRWFFVAGLLVSAGVAEAQRANNANGAQQVISPDVAADRSITFRLYAPNAKAVTLNGDFTLVGVAVPAMAKDSNGVWSAKLPPEEPGIYGYYFRVDGVRIPDPGNLLLTSGEEFLKSYVEVPGDQPQFWSLRDVPHGQVHEIWYKNPSLGQRRFYVYTPPGYDAASAKTYPTIYLYHAATDNETFWTRVGRANFIVDNLLADGKAKPVLLVMPFGHTSVPRGPDAGADGKDLFDAAAIGKDLVESVIPVVEKEFRAGRNAKDRAIYGFAMGGYQSAMIGLNHPGVFGYVAGASPLFRANTDAAENFKPLTSDLATAKTNLKYVALMAGTTETGMYPQNQRVAEYLTGLGIKNEWTTPVGTHTWQSWRGYFHDLVAHKFFVNNPYDTPPVGPSIDAIK